MSSFLTKTTQKWKELCGAPVTKDEQLEHRKAEVNEVDKYFRMLSQSIGTISGLYQQIGSHSRQIAQIITKIYEQEINSNKKIGLELQNMFENVADSFNSKVSPIYSANDHLKEWFTQIEQIQMMLATYHEDRLVYDHYLEKVEKLRSSSLFEKRGETKSTDRLTRNETKFISSKISYTKITKELIIKLDTLMDKRFLMFNGSLEEFITINNELMGDCKIQFKNNVNILKKFIQPLPRESSILDQSNINQKQSINPTQKAQNTTQTKDGQDLLSLIEKTPSDESDIISDPPEHQNKSNHPTINRTQNPFSNDQDISEILAPHIHNQNLYPQFDQRQFMSYQQQQQMLFDYQQQQIQFKNNQQFRRNNPDDLFQYQQNQISQHPFNQIQQPQQYQNQFNQNYQGQQYDQQQYYQPQQSHYKTQHGGQNNNNPFIVQLIIINTRICDRSNSICVNECVYIQNYLFAIQQQFKLFTISLDLFFHNNH